MESIERGLQIVSITAFLFYGTLCLFSEKTILEFKRYGLLRFRKLTGVLEISGALGLIFGFYSNALLLLSAGGLALLMLCGIVVRIKIKDPILAILPAFTLCIMNLFLFAKAL